MNSGTNWQGNVCTRNGITYTVNDDLSITIGGVYSERSFFYLMRPSTNIIFPSERYRITGCPTGGSADSYRLSMAYYDDSTYVSEVNETGSGNLLDLTSIATPKLQAIIEIKNSSAIGKTFYPMFRLATETDDTYEPYTGGEPAPNPIYPYAIKNTGDNVNEFDGEFELGGLNINNGEPVSHDSRIRTKNFIEINPNEDFTISGITAARYGCYYDENKVFISAEQISTNTSNNGTIKTPANAKYIKWHLVNITDVNTKEKLEQGTIATPYSPYGCGNVNEKVQNKNLFDENAVTFTTGVLDDNGNPTGSTASHYTNNFYQVTPNTNYTLKGTLNTGSSSGRIYYYDKDKKWISRSESFGSNQKTFTTPEKCYYIKIQVVVSITLKTGDVQLEQGSTASDYVPHSEQNLSFPLAEGQKLMEGDYPDDDEKVHHVSGEMLFDGSSDENWIYNPTYAYFYITTSGFKSADFCDHYSKETSETLTNNHFRFNPNNGNLYIKDERFTSASSFKTNLATNNIILQGELAEEQKEDFTEEQKTAWPEWKKARTYKNVTHISSEDETPANVEIEYVRDLETVINNLSN